MVRIAALALVAPAAAFVAPARHTPAGPAPLQNAFGVDEPTAYPAFLPQGAIGGTGPQPEDSLFGVMPWEREAYSKVFADPSQLDDAFMSANGAALDAKLEGYSPEQVSKITKEKGALEILNMAAKDLDKYFNPPPPKEKKAKKEAAKKE
mmetsp:Transcript_29149/g.87145  ORF Transcript_29149/g.87145 Transcript_29149/m.87145 type:complete len:150 (-) Transcript_29149:59-508(-)|eukprot:CAMPEP_0119271226 /NCGR_PEP_ID=MMETSP1329-20130426/7903_1 /TAXON_ID=114041 /ORGANISM="Genus nov. species nov., Strain RCC1024" /LENGTH=149 /DNA_ID=CAMNT_0007271271 /DNA_START=30 /DNA_END=479 /DNA_ORIENTATION=-